MKMQETAETYTAQGFADFSLQKSKCYQIMNLRNFCNLLRNFYTVIPYQYIILNYIYL